jgi:DNA-binding response OmpR family regulator
MGESERSRPNPLILVVEDHPDTQAAVAAYLEQRGFDVEVASNGDDAMQLLRKKRPDLVFLDLSLPNISGYDVCEQIRTDVALQETGILMTSAQSSRAVEAFCIEAGADAFLPKPFEVEQIAEHISRILLARPRPPTEAV